NVNTWQSKIYLAQYVVENVLGINNTNVDGYVDQVHATIQITESPVQGWSDQLNSTGSGLALGSQHYPHGITSTLWWLNPNNNPAYPVPSAAPAPPTGLAGFGNNSQNLLLWNGSALATGYNLWRSSVSGGPYTLVAQAISGASYTDTGLTNGVTCYYVVTATNQAGESLPSAEVGVTAAVPPPSGLTAAAGNGSVNLSWLPVIGVSGYRILRSTNSGGEYFTLTTNTQTGFTDSNVVNGRTYYYVLQCVYGAGENSPLSTEVSATPSFAIPFYAVNCGGPAVGSFAADAWYTGGSTYSTGKSINTNGAPHSAPAAVYQTERYAAASGYFTYTFTNLIPNAHYLVRLHFAEIYFTAAGQRVFNVLINGAQIVTNLDIFAAAGAANQALIREFTLPASPAGQFVIIVTNVVQNAKISGIEILAPGAYLPSLGTNLAAFATATGLTIAWPGNYTGWILQTNGGDLLNPAAWGDVPGSETNSQMTYPTVNPSMPMEFFRLRHP
ncbi:MAG TPA: malectin domain-containing carbohydrate-binding protein, partial [Candidatus Acidoferrum sp.]|nr:malectin domain-containing carbohydrate-binding protein [Candidatus Acidoferrum sp.]